MTAFEIMSSVGAGLAIVVTAAAWISSRKAAGRANEIAERLAQIEEARAGREADDDRIRRTADDLFRAVKERAARSESQTNLVGIGVEFEGPDDVAAAKLLGRYPGVTTVNLRDEGGVVWVKRFPELADLFDGPSN